MPSVERYQPVHLWCKCNTHLKLSLPWPQATRSFSRVVSVSILKLKLKSDFYTECVKKKGHISLKPYVAATSLQQTLLLVFLSHS